ncbi:hypothetical protein OC861_006800 [Tilletia horrida]|nr:hypothetical protein OC861_006800 [Tilletia horrida]
MAGNLLKLDGVRDVMDEVTRRVNNQLDYILQLADDSGALRSLSFSTLVDNPSCADPGMWFGALKANDHCLPLSTYGDKVNHKFVTIRKDVLTGDSTPEIDWDKVEDFWTEETEFLRTLAVAVHLTSGMPSRGSELFETTWRNSPGSRLRGICIGHNGEVFIDNTYSKADYKATRLQQNVRFLVPTVARVLVLYLCTVRQVSDAFHMIKHGVRRYYLWSKFDEKAPRKEARWDSSLLSQSLASFSASGGLGARLTVSDWRQLLEAIAHKYFRAGPMKDAFAPMFKRMDEAEQQQTDDDDLVSLGLEGYGDTLEDVAEVAADIMAGLRNGRSAGRAYQQDPFSAQSGRSDEVSWTFYGRNLSHRSGMDDGTMSNARWASRTYQTFFRLYEYKSPDQSNISYYLPSPQTASIITAASSTQTSHAMSMSNASTSSTATSSHYDLAGATLVSQAGGSDGDSMRSRTSTLPSTWSLALPAPMARFPLTSGLSTILFDLLVRFQQSPTKRRRIPPPIADALHCVDRRLTNCVVVAGTGTGKALAWQVGSRIAKTLRQFVLLVVPYVALLTDVVRICEIKDITVKEWRAANIDSVLIDMPNVVVISLNRAVSDQFLQWTARIEVRAAMRTVFVDECHVLVEETFRRSISEFARLTHVLSDKQFVFLTATLAPALEKDFERQICLPVKFFREATHRTNLAFSVKRANHIQEALTLAKVKIHHTLRIAQEQAQVLVICKTIGEAVQAGAFLDCPVYHASLSDDTTLAESKLPGFLNGDLKVLAGTTAAGVGIDVPKIALVVFLGDPYSIASFAQGAGRAGRDGNRAEVVVYRIGTKPHTGSGGPLPVSDAAALAMLLGGKYCLQQPLTHWLDGRMSSCIELGTEFCSVCRLEEAAHRLNSDCFSDFVHTSPQTSQPLATAKLGSQPRALTTPKGSVQEEIHVFTANTDMIPSCPQSEPQRGTTRKSRPWQEPETPMASFKRGRVDIDTDLFGPDFGMGPWYPATPMSEGSKSTSFRVPATPSSNRSKGASLAALVTRSQPTEPIKRPGPFKRASNHTSSAGGFRGGGSLGPGRGKAPVRTYSTGHPTADPSKPMRTLSEIGNTLHPGFSSFTELLSTKGLPRPTSPPSTSIARMVNPDPEYAQQLASFETYRRMVRDALPKAIRTCPMCFMLERNDDHRPGSCKMEGVSWADQQTFREHPDNWSQRKSTRTISLANRLRKDR